MYARLHLFKLDSGERPMMQELIDKFDPILSSRKGFKDATYFGDDTEGEYGALILWESENDAKSAREDLYPLLERALNGKLKEKPRSPLFEVYEP
jgi:hypothetical protein